MITDDVVLLGLYFSLMLFFNIAAAIQITKDNRKERLAGFFLLALGIINTIAFFNTFFLLAQYS